MRLKVNGLLMAALLVLCRLFYHTTPTAHRSYLELLGVPFPGAAFYDFRNPNANRLMMIGETWEDGHDFTVRLPGSFAFYERSWGIYSWGGEGSWKLNGTTVGSLPWNCNCTGQGLVPVAQLLPDTTHTVEVDNHGGLALVYRVP